MILVTGATGTVGAETAQLLARKGPVRILARDPQRVRVNGDGVQVVQGTYDDSDSLHTALRNVRAALLVTNNPLAPHDAAFLEQAARSGVRHIVKLSAAAVADPAAQDLVTRWQRANEQLLTSSGLAWTLLRPRSFMSNTLSWAPGIKADGVVHALYSTSANAPVDPRDIAGAAARILDEGGHESRRYTLTGPQTLSAADQTEQLSTILNRPLRVEELTPQQAHSQLLRRYPAPIADALIESAQRQQDGRKAHLDTTLTHLLGRPARSYRTWATAHIAAFT
ncbi:NAD(P)H-binding protein [Streptomyces sp. NPDC019890]|uniref:NAD(P)H-binding protein n=1 Tax=Streptomyces sp. NPDC019890 TaxID=3365064 RepID=UPI00384D3AED